MIASPCREIDGQVDTSDCQMMTLLAFLGEESRT